MTSPFQDKLSQAMEGLKEKLSVLIDELPAGAPVVYFDQPLHLNVGDLLINLGLERLLAEHGRFIEHRFSVKDYARNLHHVRDNHVIVLHGGGNLGDLWPNHEKLRQDVVKRFPRNKILVFPQTVHFRDPSKIDDYAAVYRAHPNCKIFLRDHASLALVGQKFRVPCALAPDTAHQLWRNPDMFTPGFDGHGTLTFMRLDREAQDATDRAHSLDWPALITPLTYALAGAWIYTLRFNPSPSLQPALMRGWGQHRDRIIRHSANVFRQYARVRTDRLHALILGCLLGKPVVMKDNNYGKLSSYCDAWMPDLIERA